MSTPYNAVTVRADPVDAGSTAHKRTRIDKHFVADVLLRITTAMAMGAFAVGAISHWLASPGRITLLFLVVANVFTTGLTLVSRRPKQRDWRPIALLCSLGGTYGCIAYNLNPGIQVVPETLGILLQISGIIWQLFAKASLRRSFGVLPANRGVVSRGAYRFVRHPMYLGYLISDLGFLLTNLSLYNMSVYIVQLTCQVGRITQEERMLSGDEKYRAYRAHVRFRLLPGLF